MPLQLSAVAVIVKLATAVVGMSIELYPHQKIAIDSLKSGSILCGGVGSGKSRAALAFYFLKVCEGNLKINGEGSYSPMKKPRNLFIITTAKKRDSFDWEKEMGPFLLSTRQDLNPGYIKVVVDSWNNIGKYIKEENAFFIFDEQRVVGSGAWVKAFYKITKPKQLNKWILLSATPGDTWMDYIPIFVANGFYKNRTEFIGRHVVYNANTKYPKIDHYLECRRLLQFKNRILVSMPYTKTTVAHHEHVRVEYDAEKLTRVSKERWNIFKDRPVRNVSELCYTMRKVVNSDPDRITKFLELAKLYPKLIVFYNFDYELFLLREACERSDISYSEWNGHKHEALCDEDRWVYLVQYTSGAEAWECTDTNGMLFYSQNYSYKIMTQAAGRTDRANTMFSDLYYYHFRSDAPIDKAIAKALQEKKTFNANNFVAM